MYLADTYTGDKVKIPAMESAPFGPGFPKEQAEKADKMEVWGSSFEDPGPDFCEFRLFKGEELLETKRVGGY